MKKLTAILLIVLICAVMFAGCAPGGGRANFAAAPPAPVAAPAGGSDFWLGETAPASLPPLTEEAVMWDIDDGGFYSADVVSLSAIGGGEPAPPGMATRTVNLGEMIIYTVSANIETLEFDETITAVEAMIMRYGAFIENSSVAGVTIDQPHHTWPQNRHAHFTLRVPVQQLDAMTGSLNELGNVTFLHRNAQNITTQFIDTQSRLAAFRAQEESLLNMLSRAENVEEMILVYARLAEVFHEIESMTSRLQNWQNQVDFSTLTLWINEVEQYTEIVSVQRTYWQQIGYGLGSTTRSIGRFFMDIFEWVIVNSPVLAIIAAVVIAGVIIVKRKLRPTQKPAQTEVDEQP